MDWNQLIREPHSQADFIIENYEILFNRMQEIVDNTDKDSDYVVTLFHEMFAYNAYMRKLYDDHFIESMKYREPEWQTVMRFMRKVIENVKLQSEKMKVINKNEVKQLIQEQESGEQ